MRNWTKERANYLFVLARQRAFSRWIALASLAYGLFSFWRDEFASSAQQEQLRAVTYLPAWPFSWWVAIFFAALSLWIFVASFRLHRSINDELDHGLVLGDFELSLDASNVVNTLEARLVLENHTTRPIRFHFTEYEFSIEGLLIKAIIAPTVIPAKGRLTTFPRCGLSRANYLLLGTNTQGKMKYTVEYGNPNLPVSRRATKTLIVDVFKRNGGNTVNWNWMGSGEESDTPI